MSDKKMKRSVKKKWVEALRSGEFEQASGVLCDGLGGYCCLGVLSELAVREGAAESWNLDSGMVVYGKKRGRFSTSFLAPSVMRWAGLKDEDPGVANEDGDGDYLSSLNDSGHTFEQIADLIEQHL